MTKLKIVIASLLWIAYFSYDKIFKTPMQNQVYLNQMNDTTSSFTDVQVFVGLNKWAGLALLIITVLIFLKEIKNLKKYFEEKEF